MKKTVLLLVVFIALLSSVYANGFNVNAGIGFANRSFAVSDSDSKSKGGFNAFQAQIGADYTLPNNMFIYGDVSMAFPSKIFSKYDGDNVTISKDDMKEMMTALLTAILDDSIDVSIDKVSFMGYSFSAGCGYCLKPIKSLAIKLGAGLRYDAMSENVKNITIEDESMSEKDTTSAIGIGLHLEADYMLTNNFGIMLSLQPNLGFHTYNKSKTTGDALLAEAESSGDFSGVSTTFNATVGAVFAL